MGNPSWRTGRSTLLALTAGPEAAKGAWAADVETDLAGREHLDGERYQELRGA
jgi:hypothetical protein